MTIRGFQLFATINDDGTDTGLFVDAITGDDYVGPVFAMHETATGEREHRDETLYCSTLECAAFFANRILDRADARKTCRTEEAAVVERFTRRDETSVSWLRVDGSALWTVTATVAVLSVGPAPDESLGAFGKEPEPVHATDAARVDAGSEGGFFRGGFFSDERVTGPVWRVRTTADFSAETGVAGDVTELRASHWTSLEAAEECAIGEKRFQGGADVVVTRVQ